MTKNKGGRPTKMTESTVKKLEEAFLEGMNDSQACLIADISRNTFYNYCDDNPEFNDRKEILKQQPKITAKKNIRNALKAGDKDISKWLLEKTEEEFNPKIHSDVTSNGKTVTMPMMEVDGKPLEIKMGKKVE